MGFGGQVLDSGMPLGSFLPGGGWSCLLEILTSKGSGGSRGCNTEGDGDAVRPRSSQKHGLCNLTNWIAVTALLLASYANSGKPFTLGPRFLQS